MHIPRKKTIERWVLSGLEIPFPRENGQLMDTLAHFPVALVAEQLLAAQEAGKIQEILDFINKARTQLAKLTSVFLAINGAIVVDETHVVFTLAGKENQTDTGTYIRLIRDSAPIAVDLLNEIHTFGIEREDSEARTEMQHLVHWSLDAPDPPLPLNGAHVRTAIDARRGVSFLTFACLRQLNKIEKDRRELQKILNDYS